ncbi:unnamed protein product [Discosporangium mesarthrocarpum]
MNKRKMSLMSSFENISPQVISRVGREIQDFQKNPPDGIRFLPQEEDSIAEIHVEIMGPVGTPYDGGRFHMKLVLSNDFPHSPPRGFFLTKIFHPNVAPNGDICVNTLKRDWTPEVTLSHVLQVIRCLLIVPFPESSLNEEAGKLFMESYAEFERRAKLWVGVHASKTLATGGAGAEGAGAGTGGKGSISGVSGVGGTGAGSGARGSSGGVSGAGDVGGPLSVKKNRGNSENGPKKVVKDKKKEAKKKGLRRL